MGSVNANVTFKWESVNHNQIKRGSKDYLSSGIGFYERLESGVLSFTLYYPTQNDFTSPQNQS